MTALTPERRAELRGLLHNHNADAGEWCCDVLPQAAMDALPALLDAADERDQLLTVADTLGRVNGEYAMEIHRCREALGVDEDTDPHHAAQALAAAVEHWHLACIGESIRVSELEAELLTTSDGRQYVSRSYGPWEAVADEVMPGQGALL